MANSASAGRQIDPAMEAERLAKERTTGPMKVLHVGDPVRVYDAAGTVFTGRITGVERRAVPHPERHRFSVVCEPLREATDG